MSLLDGLLGEALHRDIAPGGRRFAAGTLLRSWPYCLSKTATA
jgi:hypothetical protein